MSKTYESGDVSKHVQNSKSLLDLTRDNKRDCFYIVRLASELRIDVRTVRTHL